MLAILFHARILTALAAYLDQSGPPEKADLAFVLAGDAGGRRILKGAELAREGYVPRVVVSGPAGNYGYYECDLAIPFAVKAGYPESEFVRFPNQAHSTREEAAAAAIEFRSLGAHRVLLVTSLYHTRRAGVDFRAAAPDLTFIVVAAPDENFSPDGWWHNREASKTFLLEWTKTVATWFKI
ncbi:MAG TPA: YdcF family protein [Bryobacteraceae bacterium]